VEGTRWRPCGTRSRTARGRGSRRAAQRNGLSVFSHDIVALLVEGRGACGKDGNIHDVAGHSDKAVHDEPSGTCVLQRSRHIHRDAGAPVLDAS